jgi:hypothetical protein
MSVARRFVCAAVIFVVAVVTVPVVVVAKAGITKPTEIQITPRARIILLLIFLVIFFVFMCFLIISVIIV